MKAAGLALSLAACGALSGCAGNAFSAMAAAQPVFDLAAFFAGQTIGTGTLSVVGRERVATYVEGTGRTLADGSIRLRQWVTEGAKKPSTRTWLLSPQGDGRWTGTLTTATGPVEARVTGNEFHLEYLSGGLNIEQWLYLEPGGRTVKNTLVATKLGVTIARLEETIRKVG